MHKWVVCCVALIAATASAAIPSLEREALVALYEGTAGPAWHNRTNWLGAAGTECTWYGVKCNDGQTAVTSLLLAENNLARSIPPAVSQLLAIEVIDLYGNALSGSLAPLAPLTTLRELWLGANEFAGPIPATELRGLRNLELLELTFNGFSGPIPIELAGLTNLRALGLHGNELEGEVPIEIWRMATLEELWLSDNALTGSIPAEAGSLVNLRYLSLWGNHFTGPIPPELGAMKDLVWLELSYNEFSGVPPASLGGLTKLEILGLSSNHISGPIPDWIAGLPGLTYLTVDDNELTGHVPGFLWTLTNLETLTFGSNHVTGSLPPQIGNLTSLELLAFHFTSMSGPLPPEIGNLRALQYLYGSGSGLTGPLPAEIGDLTDLNTLWLWDNQLEGPLPPEIGNLVNLEILELGSNRLSGPIPREIGNLVNLTGLKIDENALRGAIPREITNLTRLEDRGGLWSFSNALFIDDPAVRQFMEQKDLFGADGIQTVTPENVRVIGTTDRSATIGWERINHFGPGAYQIVARTTPGGPAVAAATTDYLFRESGVVYGLDPETTYSFTVAAITYPDYSQKNLIISDPSAPVPATTGVRVLAPPDVQVTERPVGLIQIEGVPRNEDRFTVTNVGDLPTAVTLDVKASFATFEPAQFTLAGGASQTVVIRSIPQPPGSYYGSVWTAGEGAINLISVSLFSATRPEGTARAEAIASRVEVAGEPGSDSVGQARFKNVGDSQLVGILVSDQPWVVPDDSRVFISPGTTAGVTFRVFRSRRPPGVEGALVANLTLMYVAAGTKLLSRDLSDPPPGVSVTKVTVVDVSRPATSLSTIPGTAGAIAFFLSGVSTFARDGRSFFSDVSLLNNSAGRPISDLRLYYTPAATGQTTVATLSTIPATTSVTLANVVTTVYEISSGVGSLQVRTSDWENVVVQAKLLGLSEAGSVAGEVPVFRSDRSIAPGQKLYLTGLAKSSTRRTDVLLQETSGAAATVRIDFLDRDGGPAGTSQESSVAAWGMLELPDRVPAGAVTAAVLNSGPGQIAAYARVFDETTGDHWSIVDWSRFHGFRLGEPLRVPFVEGRPPQTPGSGRRRAVPHGAGTGATTDLSLFNASAEDVVARMDLVDSNGTVRPQEDVVVAPGHTHVIQNAGGQARTATAQVVITPLGRGELVMTARSSRTGVPVIPAASGLRLGQAKIFSNLEDSTAATVAGAVPGTYRTTFGMVETGGASAVVRARIYLDEGRALATSVIYRDFTIGAGEQIIVDDLVRAIVGASRETSLGELHNLQLRVEVIGGDGSVVPFVIATDNATGDSLLRLE